MAAGYCPNPSLYVVHRASDLFVAGPCLLGSAINSVEGRDPQAQFESGDTLGTQGSESRSLSQAPGRTIMLHQNKTDFFEAHRFTLLEEGLTVASTDLPDSNDITNKKHYSDAKKRGKIYGLENVYANSHKANEDVRFTFQKDELPAS